MAYIKKSELVVWSFKIANRVVYVTTAEGRSMSTARLLVESARIRDVFTVEYDSGKLITSLDAAPRTDVSVDVCAGGKSQYEAIPTVRRIVDAYVKRQQKKKEDAEKKAPCDGEIVEIKGQKYKLSLVK
jgi:hypothetical protein